jgi:hypothetical protein
MRTPVVRRSGLRNRRPTGGSWLAQSDTRVRLALSATGQVADDLRPAGLVTGISQAVTHAWDASGMSENDGGLGREPTSEELAMAASGLPLLAIQWVEAVRRRDASVVWEMTDPRFRLALAQMWIWNNREAVDQQIRGERISRDELADQLASASPQHPLWAHCARVSMRTISEAAGDLDRELGPGTRPRLIGPDLEIIRLFPLDELPVDENGNKIFPPGMEVEALTLIMRFADDQWKVGGIGEYLTHPGWPPTSEKVATRTD